jgi:hypothetical protein
LTPWPLAAGSLSGQVVAFCANNLIKRIGLIGFGFRNFENYRNPSAALRRQAELACAGSIVSGESPQLPARFR